MWVYNVGLSYSDSKLFMEERIKTINNLETVNETKGLTRSYVA